MINTVTMKSKVFMTLLILRNLESQSSLSITVEATKLMGLILT